ncbi:U3 snoRNP protein [Lobulomyces angularis]|nr:U3 snoRNP protein [Lobulomyces angularis]
MPGKVERFMELTTNKSNSESDFNFELGDKVKFLQDNCQDFLLKTKPLIENLTSLTTNLYKKLKPELPHKNSAALDNLLTDGYDNDQIWEQIMLLNNPLINYINRSTDNLIASGDDIEESHSYHSENLVESLSDISHDGKDEEDEQADVVNLEAQEENSSEEESVAEGEDIKEMMSADGISDTDSLSSTNDIDEAFLNGKRRFEKTVVDDEFFSLREMEKFSEIAEKWDFKQQERQFKKNEAFDSDSDVPDDVNVNEFDLGLDFFSMDPDKMDEDVESDEDADLDNANDIMYEEFFGPRVSNTEKLKPTWKKSTSIQKRTWEDAELDYDQDDGYYNGGVYESNSSEPKVQESGSSNILPHNDGDTVKPSRNLLEDDDLENQNNLSTFEKEQNKLSKTIKKLEDENVAPKPWVLMGEANSKSRPLNALLEEHLEVDYAAKPVPIITEETTKSLEDIIKDRIKDGIFDDVERKYKEVRKNYDPNRRLELDDEKSKVGLGEIYEKDYLKQTSKNTNAKTEIDQKVQAAHDEIKILLKNLNENLDILSNWNYKPKAPKAELTIVSQKALAPAIELEEVIPSSISNSTLLAPKEIFEEKLGKSITEKESSDKRRDRLKKRKRTKLLSREKEKLIKESLSQNKGNAKVEKEKAVNELIKEGNVTIIGGNDKLGKKLIKENKTKKAGGARILEKGDKYTIEKKNDNVGNLKL